MFEVIKSVKTRLSSEDEDSNNDHGGLVTQEAAPKLKRPSMYRVVLMNDDFTPMEFVVEVLMIFFNMNQEKATQVMLSVHTQGKGLCAVSSRDVAETKATQVNQYARDNKHPLLSEVEAV